MAATKKMATVVKMATAGSKSLDAALLAVILLVVRVSTQDAPKLLVVSERSQQSFLGALTSGLQGAGKWDGAVLGVAVDREEDEDAGLQQVCSTFAGGASLVLDLTWGGWNRLRDVAARSELPYLRAELSLRPFLQATDELLTHRNVTDAALVFSGEDELTQGLYYLVERSSLRVVLLPGLDSKNSRRLSSMRPTPTVFAVLAGGARASDLLRQARDGGVVQRFSRWTVVLTDFQSEALDRSPLDGSAAVTTILTPGRDLCCSLRGQDATSDCQCPPESQVPAMMVSAVVDVLNALSKAVQDSGVRVAPEDCSSTRGDPPTSEPLSGPSIKGIMELVSQVVTGRPGLRWDARESSLSPQIRVDVEMANGSAPGSLMATWTAEAGFQPAQPMPPIKRYFRVGTVETIPWAYQERDPDTGQLLMDEQGQPRWTGYCVDFIQRLSELMDFDYDLVPPKDGSYGERNPDNGIWDGAVGDLASGETDILVAALTMTSEREEVIDFVPPYFEQSGISIVIRKPVRKTSLFKFMTVLRLEVWLSIVAALVVTGFMIWLLDKYSPYSARNNKEMYPYPCREFTLKESFWFALTSFTPQGGGEAPKALSGRTLVAAYWLFVVLMLATFTANLAAFLTVERMQTPVQSLEQLARQSRINYTVVNNSDTHAYFKNMKHAEDTLYRVWKEITLNASSDQSQYRVWDYPIREQYGHILLAIEKAGPVENASVGFQKVIDSEDAEFAFIHNAAHVRYQVSKNCNLTEVGELFAEQPYAVAVQQGSYLQEEISRRILELQKDRYFETLMGKYWNYSALASCPNSGDNEGITLESLGGVFIATLAGLAFAMVTLAGEVFYYHRKKKKSEVEGEVATQGDGKAAVGPKDVWKLGPITLDKNGKNVLLAGLPGAVPSRLRGAHPQDEPVKKRTTRGQNDRVAPLTPPAPGVSYISVYPRDFY